MSRIHKTRCDPARVQVQKTRRAPSSDVALGSVCMCLCDADIRSMKHEAYDKLSLADLMSNVSGVPTPFLYRCHSTCYVHTTLWRLMGMVLFFFEIANPTRAPKGPSAGRL